MTPTRSAGLLYPRIADEVVALQRLSALCIYADVSDFSSYLRDSRAIEGTKERVAHVGS